MRNASSMTICSIVWPLTSGIVPPAQSTRPPPSSMDLQAAHWPQVNSSTPDPSPWKRTGMRCTVAVSAMTSRLVIVGVRADPEGPRLRGGRPATPAPCRTAAATALEQGVPELSVDTPELSVPELSVDTPELSVDTTQ